MCYPGSVVRSTPLTWRGRTRMSGFGTQKAKIFVALLGKQLGVEAPGWREATAPFGEAGRYLSVADIVAQPSRDKVRDYKKQMKAAAKAQAV